MFDPGQLHFDSQISRLPATEYSVLPRTPVAEISHHIEDHHYLAGVLMVEQGQPATLFSRDRFLEIVSGRFGFALYERRSIGDMRDEGTRPWVVRSHETIPSIADQASHRDPETVFDPVVVDHGDGRYTLVSANELFLAQSVRPDNRPGNEGTEVDWELARATTDGEDKILKDIAAAFLTEGPSLIEAMRESLAVEPVDFERLRRSTHSLKSSFGYFGVCRGCPQAGDVEQMAEEHSQPPVERIEILAHLCQIVCDQLGAFIQNRRVPV